MKEKNQNRSRDEAVEKIECYIIENKLKPHAKIPSERDMCDMWNFNRTTLRSAIQRLIVENKLYNKKGSGTFVAQPKLVRNLQDLKALSTLVKENGQIQKDRVLSFDVIESNKQITQKLHVPLGHKVYALNRLRFIDEEPAIIETSFLDYERFRNLNQHDFSKESLYYVMENEFNVQIVQGQEKIGIAYTSEYESELLNIEAGHAVFYLSGVTYDGQGEPIEYFKSIVRSDKIKFASTLKR